MTARVLFVCLGNICRSPTAEGVLRALAEREFKGLKLEVDSAGTANYHVGEPPGREHGDAPQLAPPRLRHRGVARAASAAR